jgi:hypothetical protein
LNVRNKLSIFFLLYVVKHIMIIPKYGNPWRKNAKMLMII